MSRKVFLLLLLISAFGIRIGAVAAFRGFSAPPSRRHGADGVEFEALAAQLASAGVYSLPGKSPSSFRAPGFPLFLASIYLVTGRSMPVVYFVLAALGALSCLLTYLLARELVPEPTARIAGSLAVVYLPHILFATRFDSENLFVPVLALSLLLFIQYGSGGGIWQIALSGFLLGFSALVRPFSLILMPIWMTLLLTRFADSFTRRILSAIAFATLFIGAIAPWTLRNYSVHGQPVLIATNGGSTFYGSNNDVVANRFSHYGGWVSTTILPDRDKIDAMPDESSHDRKEWQLGITWVRDHPGRLPWLLTCKLVRLWLPDVDSPNRPYVILQVLFYTPLMILMAVGWISLISRRSYYEMPWLATRATLIATVIVALIFWGSPRFRDANTPVLMIYSAIGLDLIARLTWRDHDRGKSKNQVMMSVSVPRAPSPGPPDA